MRNAEPCLRAKIVHADWACGSGEFGQRHNAMEKTSSIATSDKLDSTDSSDMLMRTNQSACSCHMKSKAKMLRRLLKREAQKGDKCK